MVIKTFTTIFYISSILKHSPLKSFSCIFKFSLNKINLIFKYVDKDYEGEATYIIII